MKHILATAFAAAITTGAASAAPVTFDIALDAGTILGSGTFVIDDSFIAPNAVVRTGDVLTSLDLAGVNFSIPFSPDTEFLIFDSFGEEIAGLADVTGATVDFVASSGEMIAIDFVNGPVPGTFDTINLNGLSGTFTVERVAGPDVSVVPLPAALPMLLGGLGALGFGWRRKRVAAA